MLYFTEQTSDCTGCSACMAACPVGCITMTPDEEGFLYPVASDQCIHCNRCRAVCPLSDTDGAMLPQTVTQTAVCALTKDNTVWQQSASGGAFSEICRAFGDENTIVCGAAWDGLRVHHVCVEGVQAIAPLRKSKYVASHPEGVFAQIKRYLADGRSVVFCGTPCQVAGLRRFLGGTQERLLLIDLICHGVGSPSVFAACVDTLSRQFGATITSYEFRAKKIGRGEDNAIYLKNDPYIQLFLSQNILRPSCAEHCRFRCADRQGDLTLGDFKGLAHVFASLNGSDKNYSTVVANSEKGHRVLQALTSSMYTYACTTKDVEAYNPLFSKQTRSSDDRDRFFEDFRKDPAAAIQQWTKPARIFRADESPKQKLWRAMPGFLKRTAMRVLRRLKGATVIKESEYASCGVSKISTKQ